MSYRYLGNKTRLSEWIVGEIARYIAPGATVADPMCGTAAISAALAESRYNVIASDALEFPVTHARVRLLAKSEPEFRALGGYRRALRYLERLDPVEGYFYREFGAGGCPTERQTPRLYFSARNAGKIDAARTEVKRLHCEGLITDLEHSVLLHNLILGVNRVANISGTYGYFRSTLSQAALREFSLDPIEFVNTPGHHQVLKGNVEQLAPELEVDAVYLDPPYTKRQYAGNYHILETIALEDEPIAVGDGGLRPWKDQASSFCYKRHAANAFRETLQGLKTDHVFVSYSEDGQVSEDELQKVLEEFGAVQKLEFAYQRYRSNGKVKDGDVREHLYHLEVYGQ